MILCDGNYGLGAYNIDSVHNREPERSHLVLNIRLAHVRQAIQHSSSPFELRDHSSEP